MQIRDIENNLPLSELPITENDSVHAIWWYLVPAMTVVYGTVHNHFQLFVHGYLYGTKYNRIWLSKKPNLCDKPCN